MKSTDVPSWPKALPRELEVPQTNLCFHLFVSAARFPDHAAIIDSSGSLSYRQLAQQVDHIAAYLQCEIHVRRGERILLYAANSREWISAYFAILRLGAVVVPVNPMNRSDELAHYLDDAEPVVAFCAGDNLQELLHAPGSAPLRRIIAMDGAAPPPKVEHLQQILLRPTGSLEEMQHHPQDLALILYSSGTTGTPKGCMHTHHSLNASTVTVAHWMGLLSHSVQLVALPFFHITGMQNLLNGPVYGAGTLVLMPRWNRDEAARLIRQYGVTHWTAMPTMVIDFLASPRLQEYSLASIRRIGGGGAGMPAAVGQRLQELTGLDFLEGYGLSETAHVGGNPAHAAKRQCLGIPLFNTDLRIIDPDTLRELGAGVVGEIVASGPQVFSGYWRNDEATRQAFVEIEGHRFVRTGDLGMRDTEGYFFMVDRLKRMINASGFKVWPAEVEALLHKHPGIAEACIISAPDPYRGETVKAVVVLREGQEQQVSAQDIIDWSRRHMAAYKYPRLVQFVRELPKTATGKIAWRQLQEQELAAGSAPI